MMTTRISFLCVFALVLGYTQSAIAGFGPEPSLDWTVEKRLDETTVLTFGIRGWGDSSVIHYGGSFNYFALPLSAQVTALLFIFCIAALIFAIYLGLKRSTS